MQLALIILRPKMSLVAHSNQLRADANFASFPSHASLKDVINAQFTPDLAYSFVRVLIGHGRGASYHTQVFGIQLAEIGNRLFCEAIVEVLLSRVIAHILERQHCQHYSLLDVGVWGRRRAPDIDDACQNQDQTSYLRYHHESLAAPKPGRR